MTFFFVLRLAFSTYPCCWKENWKKFKKIWTIWGFFGKILVRSDPGKLQASGKKKQKKKKKNQTISKFFWKILGESKGVSTMATTIFCKKVQKNSPNGTIFGKILVRRRPGFLLDRKKNWKKFKIFRPLSFFSGRYLIRAHRAFYRLPERKIEKKSAKIRPFTVFCRRYLDGATQ